MEGFIINLILYMEYGIIKLMNFTRLIIFTSWVLEAVRQRRPYICIYISDTCLVVVFNKNFTLCLLSPPTDDHVGQSSV